jgi:8-amino-7-oxononanoate synthase
VAETLAALQGGERALLAPSTLHAFWDLMGVLAGDDTVVYVDEGLYPIGKWGVERVATRGVSVYPFRHYDPDALRRALTRYGRRGRRPIVVADGLCPACGCPAPLPTYVSLAEDSGGVVIIDDTQALGILGHDPGPGAPYGHGGGGLLRWSGVGSPNIVVVTSLAKGFGVPLASITGSKTLIRRFETRSQTRVYCSPPSAAAVAAAAHALRVNERMGDLLRQRLWSLVRGFRTRLHRAGLVAEGADFPVQSVHLSRFVDPIAVDAELRRRGVSGVLVRPVHGSEAYRIAFLITVRHSLKEIDRAVDALARLDVHGRRGVRWTGV